MKKTRPAPVNATFLHEFNDVFVFISSTTIEGEIDMYLQAIGVLPNDGVAGDDTVFLSLAEKLRLSLHESVGSLDGVSQLDLDDAGYESLNIYADAVKRVLRGFSALEKQQLYFRLQQLKKLITHQKKNRFGDTYAMPRSCSHRWYELIAGRMLHADVICLDVDAY